MGHMVVAVRVCVSAAQPKGCSACSIPRVKPSFSSKKRNHFKKEKNLQLVSVEIMLLHCELNVSFILLRQRLCIEWYEDDDIFGEGEGLPESF